MREKESVMKELYRQIRHLDLNRENELITVTKGPMAGLEVLMEDGVQIWSSGPDYDTAAKDINPSDIFRERLTQSIRLVVCGCGFVGQAVIRLGKFLGWHVTGLDDRREYTAKAKDLGADRVICGSFETILPSLPTGNSTCYVIVTREHSCDRACLDQIMKKTFGYVGMMGSRKRVAMMRTNLINEGADRSLVDQICAPIGLSIGAQTPEEIAVSIIAEIMQKRSSSVDGSIITDDMAKALRALCESDEHAVMAVVTSKRGSGPREPGARMLVYPDGHTVGTIGGGLMEAEVIARAFKALGDPSSFTPCSITIDLSGKKGEPSGMLCGGVTDVFLEIL